MQGWPAVGGLGEGQIEPGEEIFACGEIIREIMNDPNILLTLTSCHRTPPDTPTSPLIIRLGLVGVSAGVR